MQTVNQERMIKVAHLLTAIEQAKQPGECRYFRFGLEGERQPLCVIGQLLAIENLLDDVDDMHNEHGQTVSALGIFEIEQYDMELLGGLQETWDCDISDYDKIAEARRQFEMFKASDEEVLRQIMRQKVLDWWGEEMATEHTAVPA